MPGLPPTETPLRPVPRTLDSPRIVDDVRVTGLPVNGQWTPGRGRAGTWRPQSVSAQAELAL